MFLPKIAGADFYRLDEFFLFLLLHFCICLGHVAIAMCSAQICCVFWCWFNFFSWIITINFLVLCFCQKLQEPILIGWASILLLLLHFCFCLGYAIILAGPALICCSFHCLINFFLQNSFCLFVVAMFAHNWQVLHIYHLGKFLGIAGSCLLCIGCMHNSCGAWLMFCVLFSRFADFLT